MVTHRLWRIVFPLLVVTQIRNETPEKAGVSKHKWLKVHADTGVCSLWSF
jgi:hypothetical protein